MEKHVNLKSTNLKDLCAKINEEIADGLTLTKMDIQENPDSFYLYTATLAGDFIKTSKIEINNLAFNSFTEFKNFHKLTDAEIGMDMFISGTNFSKKRRGQSKYEREFIHDFARTFGLNEKRVEKMLEGEKRLYGKFK